jgi:hypothetical protein
MSVNTRSRRAEIGLRYTAIHLCPRYSARCHNPWVKVNSDNRLKRTAFLLEPPLTARRPKMAVLRNIDPILSQAPKDSMTNV